MRSRLRLRGRRSRTTDAPVDDFPRQPSQKDGLGRMCKPHWNQYTAALARDAKARKAAAGDGTAAEASAGGAEASRAADAQASQPAPKRTRRRAVPVATGQGDAA